MFWKGTVWAWVRNEKRCLSNTIHIASSRETWSSLKPRVHMCWLHLVSSSLRLLLSSSFRLPWLTASFFFQPFFNYYCSAYVLFFKSLFPCSARMTSVSLHFYAYGKSLQLLCRHKLIEVNADAMCVSLSPKIVTRHTFQDRYSEWCTIFKDPEALLQVSSNSSRNSGMDWIGSELDSFSVGHVFSLPFLLSFLSRMNGSCFSATWATLITSPLIYLEANTQHH